MKKMKEISPKKWGMSAIITFFVLTVSMAVLTCVVDPYFHYHAPLEGMRYRLSKAGDGMEVVIWPGPYNFIKTPENKKQRKEFPLTIEGKEEAVKWLNEQYEVQKPLWDSVLH